MTWWLLIRHKSPPRDSRSKPLAAETAFAGSVHESGGGVANRPNPTPRNIQ